MSGEDWYNTPQGNAPQRQSNPYLQNQVEQNPWQSEESANPVQYTQSSHQGYDAPSGPPPGHQSASNQASQGTPHGNQPGQPPRRAGTFEETQFVPESERGEQREALEQFEMSKGGESQEDRDMATLQQEFPGVDGSLVAALYGDSKSLSGTREMLRELAGQ